MSTMIPSSFILATSSRPGDVLAAEVGEPAIPPSGAFPPRQLVVVGPGKENVPQAKIVETLKVPDVVLDQRAAFGAEHNAGLALFPGV